jgi:hypothetical protein
MGRVDTALVFAFEDSGSVCSQIRIFRCSHSKTETFQRNLIDFEPWFNFLCALVIAGIFSEVLIKSGVLFLSLSSSPPFDTSTQSKAHKALKKDQMLFCELPRFTNHWKRGWTCSSSATIFPVKDRGTPHGRFQRLHGSRLTSARTAGPCGHGSDTRRATHRG